MLGVFDKVNEIESKIALLKLKLHNEDYKTTKYVQGRLSKTEFDKVCVQCDAWREEINALEKELETLKASL